MVSASPRRSPPRGRSPILNWSSFTDEGLEYIATSRKVRIDLSKPPVDAASLGLAPDDTLLLERIDNLDVLLDYDLILNGGGKTRVGHGFSPRRSRS